jgi:hypothetical protein
MNAQQTATVHVASGIYVMYMMYRNKTMSVKDTQLSIKNTQLSIKNTELAAECKTLRRITDMYIRDAREQQRIRDASENNGK